MKPDEDVVDAAHGIDAGTVQAVANAVWPDGHRPVAWQIKLPRRVAELVACASEAERARADSAMAVNRLRSTLKEIARHAAIASADCEEHQGRARAIESLTQNALTFSAQDKSDE